jgi:catechol 2,3-dioxygenase-like lactoylglutathione lyase family enzyme
VRFDHGVIAVRELDPAIGIYRDVLGLDARRGGGHVGRGTENAIIRFADTYLELLSLRDPAKEIEAAGLRGQVLADYLQRREGGLVGYGLTSGEIFRDAERLRTSGLEIPEPRSVSRTLPSGNVLRWHVLLPERVNWRRPWPFLIQGDPSNQALAAEEPPGRHPLGVTKVVGVAVAVQDLQRQKEFYAGQLGFRQAGEDRVPELAALRARFERDGLCVDLLAPSGPGPVQAELDADGEGPFNFTLRVESVQAAARWLGRSGIALQSVPGYPDARLIPPERALGARLLLL